jgi:hypothetical protein
MLERVKTAARSAWPGSPAAVESSQVSGLVTLASRRMWNPWCCLKRSKQPELKANDGTFRSGSIA